MRNLVCAVRDYAAFIRHECSVLQAVICEKMKGREPNMPPLEAPRSAFGKKHAEPRPMGACFRRLFPLVKIRGFLVELSRCDAKFSLLHNQYRRGHNRPRQFDRQVQRASYSRNNRRVAARCRRAANRAAFAALRSRNFSI